MTRHTTGFAAAGAAILWLLLAPAAGCASAPPAPELADTPPAWPQAPAERLSVAVLPPLKNIAGDYPQLREAGVGLGILEAVSESLYESGWFRLVEGDPVAQDALLRQMWVQSSGITDGDAVEYGRALGARLVLYPAVSAFSVRSSRSPGWVRDTTLLGIHLRLVDVETWEWTPVSGQGEAAVDRREGFFQSIDQPETDLGRATHRAAQAAVLKLCRTLESRNR